METERITLVKEFEMYDAESAGEAFASIVRNPTARYIKFVLTDDLPNGNNYRISEEEFNNLITSGISMPVKMAYNKISNGHAGSFPLGAITHLKQENNTIVGLAALWEKERPEDIALIREKYEKKEPLELSWEIEYSDSSISEDGIKDLKDTFLRAVTLVGMPAYKGRTPITAFASEEGANDTNLEDSNLELQELEKKVSELTSLIETKDAELATASEQLKELEELRSFKTGVEKEKEEAERLASIKTKFMEASIEKDDEYFQSNKDKLLGLSEEAFEFMLQELVAFSALQKKNEETHEETSAEHVKVPNLTSKSNGQPSVKEMAEFLRKATSR